MPLPPEGKFFCLNSTDVGTPTFLICPTYLATSETTGNSQFEKRNWGVKYRSDSLRKLCKNTFPNK